MESKAELALECALLDGPIGLLHAKEGGRGTAAPFLEALLEDVNLVL